MDTRMWGRRGGGKLSDEAMIGNWCRWERDWIRMSPHGATGILKRCDGFGWNTRGRMILGIIGGGAHICTQYRWKDSAMDFGMDTIKDDGMRRWKDFETHSWLGRKSMLLGEKGYKDDRESMAHPYPSCCMGSCWFWSSISLWCGHRWTRLRGRLDWLIHDPCQCRLFRVIRES